MRLLAVLLFMLGLVLATGKADVAVATEGGCASGAALHHHQPAAPHCDHACALPAQAGLVVTLRCEKRDGAIPAIAAAAVAPLPRQVTAPRDRAQAPPVGPPELRALRTTRLLI